MVQPEVEAVNTDVEPDATEPNGLAARLAAPQGATGGLTVYVRLATFSYDAVAPWLRTSTSSPYAPAARPVVFQLNVLTALYSWTTFQMPFWPVQKR